ncbi:MAG: hypothetical protein GYA24_19550 [Candidatus Lokiarchaeota archaeon]|nr:hypothetical protein [Candidatus Lokiarchaeota archaeon]
MGWFDFLKKNKKSTTGDQDKPAETNADVDQADRAKSELHLDSKSEADMQKEAMLLQILDGLYDNPMKYLLQKRAKTEILKIMNTFLDARPAAKDYWSKPEKNIVQVVGDLLDDADRFAMARGLKISPQRMSLLVNIIMIGSIVAIFALMSLNAELMAIASNFFLIIMCAMCFVPQFLQRFGSSKFAKFQAANGPDFMKTVTPRLEILHEMVQYLLTDIRETLVAAGNDISNIRFQLWNSDYRDIKVLDSKIVPGTAKTVYVVRFVKDVEDENEPTIPPETSPDSDVDFETDPQNQSIDGDDSEDSDIADESPDDDSGAGSQRK